MIKAQAFVGIDPSLTHTGLIILNPHGDILIQKAIITKPSKDGWRAQVARQQKIVAEIGQHINQTVSMYGISIIFCEDYAPSRYAKSSIPTCELGGLLRAMLSKLPDTIAFVPPAVLKKFAAGKGNADKVAVSVAIATRFNVNFGSDDNLYDAYALARLALAFGGNHELLNAAQIKIAEMPLDEKLQGDGIHAKL